MKNIKKLVGLTLLIAACSKPVDHQSLSLIHITDRNGTKQTIDNRDRLAHFQKVDFSSAQPYEKVVRVYGKTDQHSILTSYHSNGQIKQRLESKSSRACGHYQEWHPNGTLHMETEVVEGIADLSDAAQETWKFNGLSQVFDSNGHLLAQFNYSLGLLEGDAKYFYPSGQLKKVISYKGNQANGIATLYSESGHIIGETHYANDMRHGKNYFIGTELVAPFEEEYLHDRLMKGVYYNLDKKLIFSIEHGNGFQALYKDGYLERAIEYQGGYPKGEVKIYNERGTLVNSYLSDGEKKHGEEWLYYPNGNPKLYLNWYADEIHGIVKTWYENGTLESQKEVSHNQKQGISNAWYKSGEMMYVEEYENDQLQQGKYYKKGMKHPVSTVENQRGTATLYDADGVFLQKVKYKAE